MYIDYSPVNMVRNNPLLPPTYKTWPMGRYCMPNEDELGGAEAVALPDMKLIYESTRNLFTHLNTR
jgi:hypothetical protein